MLESTLHEAVFSHLTVTVFRATGLRPKGLRGGSNPFVTLQLGSHSRRTSTVRNTLSPQWNSRVTLPLPPSLSNTATMTLRVMHKRTGLLLSDKFLGRVELKLEDIYESGGVKKWFVLQSEPQKKPKRRGRIEVALQLCADPGSSLSHTQPQSQPWSICTDRHLSWECCEPQPPSVQTAVGRCEPIQPSCAADPGLSERLPSVAAGAEEPVASPLCVSSGPVPCDLRPPSNELWSEDASDQELLLKSKSDGVTIGTQTSFPIFNQTPNSRRYSRLWPYQLRFKWALRSDRGERPTQIPPVRSWLDHALSHSYSRLPAQVGYSTSSRRFLARLSVCFSGK